MTGTKYTEKLNPAAQAVPAQGFSRAFLAGLSLGTVLLLKRPWVPAGL